MTLWVPSQNGFVREAPQRQSATVFLRVSMTSPSESTTSNVPRTR